MASCRCSPSLMVMRIFVLFCSIYWGSAQNTQSAQKPNIIMIVADDLVSEIPFLFRMICLRSFCISQDLVEVTIGNASFITTVNRVFFFLLLIMSLELCVIACLSYANFFLCCLLTHLFALIFSRVGMTSVFTARPRSLRPL